MKNRERWKPTKWIGDVRNNTFVANLRNVYPGSVHLASIQVAAYVPLIREHMRGHLLDCGCGSVPCFEIYRDIVSEITCTDWEVTRNENPFVDFYADLNQPLLIESNSFDSILMTDVLAHIKRPDLMVAEFARILKPGGKLLLTSTFINWMGEPPHEYMRVSEYAMRSLCEDNALQVLHLEPYGGRADVLLDTLNKGMTGKFSNRIFRMMRWVVIRTGWYKSNRVRTAKRYPIGYSLVAQKQQNL
ncbi:MAG: class I SAM-dependent methyltransferase [Flavobacteriales bacterium]|nr:class I SAM-dependent methyltransferase [Flavobacteriales bacterium]